MPKWGDFVEVPNTREELAVILDKVKEQILQTYHCTNPEDYTESPGPWVKEQLGDVKSFYLGWCICPTTEYPLPLGKD